MEKVVEMRVLVLYKEALQVLDFNDIKYDKERLLNNPELCLDIINIFNYFEQ